VQPAAGEQIDEAVVADPDTMIHFFRQAIGSDLMRLKAPAFDVEPVPPGYELGL
jgi:hypothetical protein